MIRIIFPILDYDPAERSQIKRVNVCLPFSEVCALRSVFLISSIGYDQIFFS